MSREQIERAYRNTTYFIDDPQGAFGLRLGERCPRLDALLAGRGVTCWAYVTAWNPCSRPQPAAVNAVRHADLCARVAQSGYAVLAGRGQPDSGDWLAEESLLILGMDEAAALALGAEFGQQAIVAGKAGGTAQLRWVQEAKDEG